MADYDKYWDFLGGLAYIAGRHLPEKVDFVCEYGGGYSTFFFSLIAEIKKAQHFCSIDQYEPYLRRLGECMPKKNVFKPILCELFSEDRLNSDSEDSLYYATSSLSVGRPIDVALIDGRTRMECLLVAALACSKDALIILDDADRKRYLPGLGLFEEVERIVRFRVLRVRPQGEAVRARFQANLARFAGKPVPAPKPNRQRGMLHVPVLDPLSEEEQASLRRLLSRHGDGGAVVWGAQDAAALVAAQIGETFHVSDRVSGALEALGDKSKVATLTGHLSDLSRDPNLNYSTASFFWSAPIQTAVICGHRRNECLLTTAYRLPAGGRVILRDADRLTFAPGLALYREVARDAGFALLELAADAKPWIEAGRATVAPLTQDAPIGEPGDSA